MVEDHPTLELIERDGRSTLELFRHDETARAPERDNDTIAFELDPSCLAPEVLPGTEPQLLYRNSLPEVNSSIKQSAKYLASPDAPKPILKRLLLLMTLVIIAAVTIGVGVGVWHTRRKGSSGVSPSSPNLPTGRTPTNTSTAQYILNDTSLAAVILPNGDRYLYFQDSTGLIRYVVRTATTSQWNTNQDVNISSSAKNYTPLAVSANRPVVGPEQIQLFYVSRNHQLSCSYAQLGLTAWQNDNSLANYTTAPNTRSLSVTSNLQGISNGIANVTTTLAVLFYESSNTSVAVLSRVAKRCSTPQCSGNDIYEGERRAVSWIDNSAALSEFCLLGNSSQCRAPFTSRVVEEGANFTVAADFRVIDAPKQGFYTGVNILTLSQVYQENTEKPTLSDGLGWDAEINQQSDLVMVVDGGAIYINNTGALTEDDLEIPLQSAFPFARLASASTPDNQTTYVYHQINGTTFAEESWESSVAAWGESTYINVSPSS